MLFGPRPIRRGAADVRNGRPPAARAAFGRCRNWGLDPSLARGPVCKRGDFLAKDRSLPPVQRGDLLAVFSAGAYGLVMASQYNSRSRPPEILVGADAFITIRPRETYDDLLRGER